MKNKKWLLVILLFIGSFFLIFQLIPFLVNLYLNNNAEKIVTDMITRTSDFGNHQVEFGKILLDYDYRGTFLELTDVKISPDEAIEEDKVKFYLTVERISITGFSWRSFLLDNSLQIDSAVLKKVDIESITPELDSIDIENDSGREGNDYKAIGVHHIHIDNWSISNKDSRSDSTRFSMVNLSVTAEDFLLRKEDLENPKSLFTVHDVEGSMESVAIHFNKFRNVIYANDLEFDQSDASLSVGHLQLDNKLGKYEYTGQFEKETDWMELDKAVLEIEGIDFNTFFRDGIILAEAVKIDSMQIHVFRDKRKPEDLQRRPKMIHEILSELPQKLHIDEMILENGYVSYEERSDNETPKPGEIFFDRINATIQNITNIRENLEENNEMDLEAKGRLVGAGAIDLSVKYFLEDSKGKFLMKGSIGSMPLNQLNQMLEPATRVSIRSGTLDGLYFNISANDIEGTGNVIMRYGDLKIDILGKDLDKNQNIFQRIGSFFANKMIVPSQNPDKKGELKKGEVYFKRDQHKFIFNYWWKLVFSGARSTFTGEDEAKMREKAKE